MFHSAELCNTKAFFHFKRAAAAFKHKFEHVVITKYQTETHWICDDFTVLCFEVVKTFDPNGHFSEVYYRRHSVKCS